MHSTRTKTRAAGAIAAGAVLAIAGLASAQSADDFITPKMEAIAKARYGPDAKIIAIHPAESPSAKTISGHFAGSAARGSCPETRIDIFTDPGTPTSVPGFGIGEECAVTLTAPPGDYPIEIVKIGVGWASAGGGGGQSLEDQLRIYAGGIATLGAPQWFVDGPVLTDGANNEFDIVGIGTGSRIINSGAFTISLKMANAQLPGDPAPFHDGDGCQSGAQNLIFGDIGLGLQWFDACLIGLGGDWAMYAVYIPTSCGPANDCDGNGMDDTDEIAMNPSLDCNSNGQLDSCEIEETPGLDMNMNGVIDSCEPPPTCPGDITGNGVVNSADLAELLGLWGPCP